jgi:hypothetical protein
MNNKIKTLLQNNITPQVGERNPSILRLIIPAVV